MKLSSIRIASLARPVLTIAAGFFAIAMLYIFKLGSLVPGVDATESTLVNQIRSNGITTADLLRNSVDLPYNLGMYFIQYLPFDHAGSVRILSVFIALLGIAGLFILLRQWHTERVATLGTLLLAGSSWLLHIGRHGSAEILYVLPLITLGAYVIHLKRPRSIITYGVLALSVLGSLYVPGLSVLMLALILWRLKDLRSHSKRITSWQLGVVLVIGVVVMLPFVTSLIWGNDGASVASYLRHIIGLPTSWPTPVGFLENILTTAKHLVISGNHSTWPFTAGLPLLDIFTTSMASIGIYVYIRDIKLDRSKGLLAGFATSWLLVSLGGVSISLLLPFLYIFAGEGIRYMLSEWLSIFPRNPLAKTVGLSALTIAVLVTVTFHLLSYFTVWPYLAETKAQFSTLISDQSQQ